MPVLAHLNSSLFEELFMCYSPKVLTGLRTMISLFPLNLPLTSLFKTYCFFCIWKTTEKKTYSHKCTLKLSYYSVFLRANDNLIFNQSNSCLFCLRFYFVNLKSNVYHCSSTSGVMDFKIV